MARLPRWLARAVEGVLGRSDAPADPTPVGPAGAARPMPSRVKHYRIERALGQGGMGVVYAARDELLGRPVALKMIGALTPDDQARKRFAREAKAAARVNHPHVCLVYEVGEDAGQPFIAMELLEGESLADRLARGTPTLDETVQAALQILDALGALHAEGLVHRDLKPSNVFLGPRGVKLLDFGLARPVDASLVEDVTRSQLTKSGLVVGTPQYMAPEQVYGHDVDARTDLFAAGAILFEMLAGRPAFPGRTVVEVLYATLHEHPPALTGTAAVVALDRLVRRALAKDPSERPSSAADMAAELRAIPLDGAGVARAQTLTRLIVLPFRILRPDAETDFLSFSLADAITTSLSGRDPLLVRSSLVAQRFASGELDLRRVAAEADVDRIITGTLLRSGDALRVSAQLLEVPSGTVLWSHSSQAAAGDVFGVQDELVDRVVKSLAAGSEGAPRRDVPASSRAYEFYLRANQVARDIPQLPVARDLYQECVREDPGYAPAWARLGRCHRVIGKFLEDPQANHERAEEAFRRALALNSDLSVAHQLYANLETESGRAQDAIARLLGRARATRHDPEIFGGLVHALRYAGLLEESVAAHEEARRLDPTASTSVAYTLWVKGDHARLTDVRLDVMDHHPRALALAEEGRIEEASGLIELVKRRFSVPAFLLVCDQFEAMAKGERDAANALSEQVVATILDPEAWMPQACSLAFLGRPERALELFDRIVDRGYLGVSALGRNPWCASIRDSPEFARILDKAAERAEAMRRAFVDGGGPDLLGVARLEAAP